MNLKKLTATILEKNKPYRQTEGRTANSRFAKAGVLCFYDSEVLYSSLVHIMKFSAEKPRLRKAANRYGSF
jgi:hypothetical protein